MHERALELDEHGETVLVSWFQTHPTLDDSDLVQDVLDRYAVGASIADCYYTERDVISDDFIVHAREGLRVVIRRFSDDDPETQFTLVAILGPDDDDDDDGGSV